MIYANDGHMLEGNDVQSMYHPIRTGDGPIVPPSVHELHLRVPYTDKQVPFLGAVSNGLCSCRGDGDDDSVEKWARSVHGHAV